MKDEALIIRGGKPLRGKVSLKGAKNAALPILAATTLMTEPVVLENLPEGFRDVRILMSILESLGVDVTQVEQGFRVDASRLRNTEIPLELGRQVRSSLVFLGPLLARTGRASVSRPGGCDIGDRRYDLHLHGLRALGATVEETEDRIIATAGRLTGANIEFYLPTTTGTQNVLLAALGAHGPTMIRNANTRPENQNLGAFLVEAGATVRVGNRIVEVDGKSPRGDCRFRIMSGGDELVTYLVGGALSGGEIQVENATLRHVPSDAGALRSAGVELFEWGGSVYMQAGRTLKPFDIATAPHPGINSDMQPLFSALAAMAEGESTVTDTRFTDRFQYVAEFQKLGVDISSFGNCAIIRGGKRLKGARVRATDLRTGAALVLLGLVAEGETVVENVGQIDRGYDNIEETLRAVGADMERVPA